MSAASPLKKALAGFMLGAAGMFATMYSTQAILPELSRDFGVSPSRAGLSISVVVLAVAIGGFVWGPVSDRIGRPRAIRTASLLLVPPTIGVALAPGFEALLVFRALQGLCMPGLLAVGAPYVVEAFVPRIGARAMGYYVSALVAGGLVGRLGVALASAVVGWRVAIGALAVLPLAAAIAMRGGASGDRAVPPRRRYRAAPQEPAAARCLDRRGRVLLHLRRHIHLRHLPARGAAVLVLGGGGEPRLPALADRCSPGRSRGASQTGSVGAGSHSAPSALRRRRLC